MSQNSYSKQSLSKTAWIVIGVIVLVVIPAVSAAIIKINHNSRVAQTQNDEGSPGEDSNMPAAENMEWPEDAVSANQVILKTNLGDIKLKLYPDSAPNTVANFVTLGQRGSYNDVIFHRIIQDFMIQGGDPTGTGTAGESIFGEKFPDEINDIKIEAGTLAMANSGPDTNGSQFFIVTKEAQPHLDGKHTVFGAVADDPSMEIVKKIAAVEVDSYNKPKSDVKIVGFEIVKD